ncbi:hypothetical protein [Xanthomonas vesicatoria]|uniref:Uncharacterized protein n=1 Tax=Xanthomonas vesicatoria ATCC 35937 TaxID=925775 RepID=F0BCP8_9XANT|nr:hypothetical protein [Xanthomonas vesicatoria]APP75941.1 hypothetical protein BJD12_12665 [Xanthomonas vesicatoria ATCC 35937]EGD09784.1 hypothetical protein XVE_1876 [Xanthomonas vesicatoria ATCC 35937]KTF32052.1 hypothetical protein LMG920_14295 [Xanthomonas vesicatoria]MCC8598642.1 hypothetical protein [Xanthomonas vesicatoria]MCC8607448.1 hypothetical protein [Xanthomonas vesicatoria]
MKPQHLLLALSLVCTSAWADEDISKVNGRISAEPGKAYGGLETVNGSIEIGAGAQTKDVETVNGGIRIGENARTGGVETVNGSITLGQKVIVSGGLETVNGSILTERGSQVSGGVETVNGSIGLIETDLGKDIETVNGDITVGVGSHVHGGIKVTKPNFSFSFKPSRKPRVVIGPKAVVDGPLHFEREVDLYVHRTAKVGAVTGATARSFDSDVAPKD